MPWAQGVGDNKICQVGAALNNCNVGLVSTWTLQMEEMEEKVDDEDILHTFFSLFCMIIHAGIFL